MELNAVFFQTPDLTLIMTGCTVEVVVARFTGVTCCQFTLRRPDYCLVQTGWRWKRVGATYTWQHINLVQSSSFPEAGHSFNFLHPTTRMTYPKNENKIGVSVLEAMLFLSLKALSRFLSRHNLLSLKAYPRTLSDRSVRKSRSVRFWSKQAIHLNFFEIRKYQMCSQIWVLNLGES